MITLVSDDLINSTNNISPNSISGIKLLLNMNNHICYIYIYKYRCLQDVDFILDSRYEYSFNREAMELVVSPSMHPLPENFWGKGIWSLTGIFGNNGAGKTTAIRFLLDAVVSGNNIDDVEGIIIYEQAGELYIYHNKIYEKEIPLKILVSDKEFHDRAKPKIKKNAPIPKIDTFLYLGHFSPEFSYNDLCTVGLQGLYNGSEGFRLRNDIEKFANLTDTYLSMPFSTYLATHIAQNNYRICRLLINKALRNEFKDFSFPRFIFIAPNHGGQDNLLLNPLAAEKRDKIEGYLKPHSHSFIPTKEQYIEQFIYFNLLNAYSDNYLFTNSENVIKNWYDTVDTNENVLSQFKKFAENYEENTRSTLLMIYDVVSRIVNLCHFNEDISGFYLDTIDETDKIEALMKDILSSRFYITSRFFDMYYSNDINTSSNTLSSGEQAMLNLFSRIYDAIELQPMQFDNIVSPKLLLLDEAELGFHPEWQRNYILTLIHFINALMVVAGTDFQLVLTSHSPIMLSDIPVCCCNFFKKDNEGRINNVRLSHPQTFATNIFELYRNSFFLENGLIGSFAESKLRDIEDKCQEGDLTAEGEISMVGDSRLRQYFISVLANNNKDAAIRYYKEQIRKLEEGN